MTALAGSELKATFPTKIKKGKPIMSNPITRRYDFALLFDVINGNPNGDPDGPTTLSGTGKGSAVPGWTDEQTQYWIDNATGPKD